MGGGGNKQEDKQINVESDARLRDKELYDGLVFIAEVYSKAEEDEDVTVVEVRETFFDSYGFDMKLNDVFGEEYEYDVGRTLVEDFIIRFGLGSLMNDVPFKQKHLYTKDFEEILLIAIMSENQVLQRAVYNNSSSSLLYVFFELPVLRSPLRKWSMFRLSASFMSLQTSRKWKKLRWKMFAEKEEEVTEERKVVLIAKGIMCFPSLSIGEVELEDAVSVSF